MWPFGNVKRAKLAEVQGAEAITVAKERSAKASELRLKRKLERMLKALQDAPIDVGLKSIGDALAGNSEER